MLFVQVFQGWLLHFYASPLIFYSHWYILKCQNNTYGDISIIIRVYKMIKYFLDNIEYVSEYYDFILYDDVEF